MSDIATTWKNVVGGGGEPWERSDYEPGSDLVEEFEETELRPDTNSVQRPPWQTSRHSMHQWPAQHPEHSDFTGQTPPSALSSTPTSETLVLFHLSITNGPSYEESRLLCSKPMIYNTAVCLKSLRAAALWLSKAWSLSTALGLPHQVPAKYALWHLPRDGEPRYAMWVLPPFIVDASSISSKVQYS